MLQISQVLHHFHRAKVFPVAVADREEPDEEEAVVEGYPELGNVLLARLERLDYSAHDVEAFFGVALGDFSADDGFGAYEEAFVRLVEVLYCVVCVDEGDERFLLWQERLSSVRVG
jgi:hypothetical protein